MPKSKLNTEQIIGFSSRRERAAAWPRWRGKWGVSHHTIYAWEAKFGGMEVKDAEELRSLRAQNHRLKKLVADLSLDKDMLKSVIAKNDYSSRV